MVETSYYYSISSSPSPSPGARMVMTWLLQMVMAMFEWAQKAIMMADRLWSSCCFYSSGIAGTAC